MDTRNQKANTSKSAGWKTKVLRGGEGSQAYKNPMDYVAEFSEEVFVAGRNTENLPDIVKAETEKARAYQQSLLTKAKKENKSTDEQNAIGANAADDYKRKNYGHRLDISAVHKTTGVALTQYWGLRYADQQDNFTAAPLANFSALLNEVKQATLKGTISKIQKSIEQQSNNSDTKFANHAGSTVCAAIVSGQSIYTATLGDSVAYLCTVDETDKTVKLELINKEQHITNNPKEIERIREHLIATRKDLSEQDVDRCINDTKKSGKLASVSVTGALGDLDFEKDGLTHEPNIQGTKFNIPKNGKAFLIIASDGLTEKLNDADLSSIIQTGKFDALSISEGLAKASFNAGTTDNITILVKQLDDKASQDTLLAVFDGHGNNKTAQIASQEFAPTLQRQVDFNIDMVYEPILNEIKAIMLSSSNLISWQGNVKGLFGGTLTEIDANTTFKLPEHISKIIVAIGNKNDDALTILKNIKTIANEAMKKMDSIDEKQQKIENSKYIYYLLAKSLNELETNPTKCFEQVNQILRASAPVAVANTNRVNDNTPAQTGPRHK